MMNECTSCGEGLPKNECPKSQRPCGHHCNHSWSHDTCCWCGEEWGEISVFSTAGEMIAAAQDAVKLKLTGKYCYGKEFIDVKDGVVMTMHLYRATRNHWNELSAKNN